jgi:hypothetical protein
MAKLTDTQLIVLSKAARRKVGAARVPDQMNNAAAAKVGASLVALLPPGRSRSPDRGLRR